MTRIQQRLQNVGQASIAQSGERQTEDLKVPGSIPGRGKAFINYFYNATIHTHDNIDSNYCLQGKWMHLYDIVCTSQGSMV